MNRATTAPAETLKRQKTCREQGWNVPAGETNTERPTRQLKIEN